MLLCWVGFLSFPRTVLCLLIGKLQTICTPLLWSWDFLHRWPRFKYVTLLIGSFLVALDLVGIFFSFFFFFKCTPNLRSWRKNFLKHSLWGVQVMFLKIAQKKNECRNDSFSVWKIWICWNNEFHTLFVKKKKKHKGWKLHVFFFCFVFLFVYRNLSCLNDQICMVMAWKNYYVKGS